jgi:type VI secretion system secreted protein VgrG
MVMADNDNDRFGGDKDGFHERDDKKDGGDHGKREHQKPTVTATATTTPLAAQGPVNLGSAASFVVLAATTITNSGLTTLCGDLGLSPGSSVTGAPVMSCGGILHITDSVAAQAELDATTAYNFMAGLPGGTLIAGNLGGLTLSPGLYKSTSTLEVSSGDLTLDARGNPNAVFIFQIASSLTTTPGRQVILAGGAQAANIFWQVGSLCSLDTTTAFKGTIIAGTQITMNTGAVLTGRAFALTAQVTMLSNTITKP